MKYLLDTDICIYVINDRPKEVLRRFQAHDVGDIGISSITAAELAFGVEKSRSDRNRAALEAFCLSLDMAAFDAAAAGAYGHIRADLERAGRSIGPLDLLIAAHAFSLGVTLVTNNVREFGRVKGLKVANWAK